MGIVGASDEDIIKAICGGLLISLATSVNLWLKGQITGMSGTLNAVLKGDKETFAVKISLLLSMFVVSGIFILASPEGEWFETVQEFQTGLSVFGFIFAGFVTGLGAKLQNGCTSGHGVCGLPRFSIRSCVAVGVFMCAAFATANIKEYGFPDYKSDIDQPFKKEGDTTQNVETAVILGISAVIQIIIFIVFKNKFSDVAVSSLVGGLFALGLIISGMTKRHVVLGFLTFNSDWNPALMFVLAFAVIPNVGTFYLIQNKTEKPVMAAKYCIPNNKTIDWKLITGAVLFGIGWSVGGMCPGPVFCLIPQFFSETLIFFPFLCLGLVSGMLIDKFVEKRKQQLQEKVSPVGSPKEPLSSEKQLKSQNIIKQDEEKATAQ